MAETVLSTSTVMCLPHVGEDSICQNLIRGIIRLFEIDVKGMVWEYVVVKISYWL
jgi:hypothetical protein